MEFRTVVKCGESLKKIGYATPFMMIGSCFAENLGERLKRLKFNVILNPFGIVYHPAPLAQNMMRIIGGEPYTADDLEQHNELWTSFDHHGRFSHPDVAVCLTRMNTELQQAREQLARSEWLFVTFGTAWGYRRKASGRIVANCHKYPASDFERIRFGVDEIRDIWAETIAAIQRFNPAVKVVFSISPIRHLRDGAHENQLSKSTLLLAVDKLNREYKSNNQLNETENNICYFPAYEIVLDDLRDYRFYDENMTHPNASAINYIWQRFCETLIDNDALKTMKIVENIIKALSHKPLHQTSEYGKFAEKQLEMIAKLKRQAPFLDFTEGDF